SSFSFHLVQPLYKVHGESTLRRARCQALVECSRCASIRQTMYTIKEAATRAGLTPTVARAWERRYGVVEPARTTSGYRLYDDAAIERLRTMRLLVEDGWTASAAAR